MKIKGLKLEMKNVFRQTENEERRDDRRDRKRAQTLASTPIAYIFRRAGLQLAADSQSDGLISKV